MTRFHMYGSAQPDAPIPAENGGESVTPPADAAVPADSPIGGQALGEQELEAALQLLVERAQYITGATGAALALPSGDEMVCRASAGASAPPVGARLQVQSGLTGESIARRQLLRCDNAENDPRVNLETCREMGIASIVVLPLLRRSGEIRGLFELFSDHAYAFEERDLSALERMADLTVTALDLSEGHPGSVPGFVRAGVVARSVTPAEPRAEAPGTRVAGANVAATGVEQRIEPQQERKLERKPVPQPAGEVEGALLPVEESIPSELATDREDPTAPSHAAPVPEAMRRVQKCVACGFPVSEGRTYCLDCEKKKGKPSGLPVPAAEESDEPLFLDASVPEEESWLSNHVNLLAIVVLVLGILVAIVVFR